MDDFYQIFVDQLTLQPFLQFHVYWSVSFRLILRHFCSVPFQILWTVLDNILVYLGQNINEKFMKVIFELTGKKH